MNLHSDSGEQRQSYQQLPKGHSPLRLKNSRSNSRSSEDDETKTITKYEEKKAALVKEIQDLKKIQDDMQEMQKKVNDEKDMINKYATFEPDSRIRLELRSDYARKYNLDSAEKTFLNSRNQESSSK